MAAATVKPVTTTTTPTPTPKVFGAGISPTVAGPPVTPAQTAAVKAAVAKGPATGGGSGGGGGAGDGALNANTAALTALANAQSAANTLALQSAYQTLIDTLESYGFSAKDAQSLGSNAFAEMQKGTPTATILLQIQQGPTFQAMFPGIKTRQTKGLPPITPAEYISTKDAMVQTLNEAGISPSSLAAANGMSGLDNLIALDVSPTELSNRIQQGYLAIAQAPQDVISAMQNYYGVTKGQLVQYFTDPAKNGPLLLQQAAAAQIGGAATGSGFMGKNAQSTTPAISQELALQLAQQGVTYQQAQSGFGTLATQAQLYNPLPGQGQVRGNGGAPYTASQLAEAQFFGGNAEQQLQLQAQREQAYFRQGTQVGQSGQQTGIGALQR